MVNVAVLCYVYAVNSVICCCEVLVTTVEIMVPVINCRGSQSFGMTCAILVTISCVVVGGGVVVVLVVLVVLCYVYAL